MVKNSSAMQQMQETQVWSLGQGRPPPEEKIATHFTILARKKQSMRPKRVGHDWVTKHAHKHTGQSTKEERENVKTNTIL